MKFICRIIFSLCCLAGSFSAHALQELDTIIAVVNDSIITRNELDKRTGDFKRQMTANGIAIPDNRLMQRQVLERMIIDEVQLQLAKTQGIRVDDLNLNRVLENMARNNKRTLDEMRIALQNQGIDFAAFREQTRNDLIIRELQKRMVYDRIQVTAQEIDQFLDIQKQTGGNDKFHLAHILIATPEDASPEDINVAFDRAQQALASLKEGDSFRDVALKFSQGQNALNGGDLGWRSAGELPPLFVEAARRLNKGEFSTPLRSAGGFHILQVIDKQTDQQNLLTQTHARHILMRSDAITSDEQILQTLKKIRERLDKGEDFAKLAAEFSQDPGSKNNGGDLGWATPGQFVPQFEKVMDSLAPSQISEPFRSSFGWHILQVLERRQQDFTEQVQRDTAERELRDRKADEELQLWLRRIRDEAYVEYRVKLD